MKIIKIRTNEYSNYEALLKRAGLVNESENTANPERLYVNETTYRVFKKKTTEAYKREYPGMTKKSLAYHVGMYMLNLGPAVFKNKNGGAALRDGHALIVAEQS